MLFGGRARKDAMAQRATPTELIMETIAHRQSCYLDELVTECPTLTWNRIFLEVDRLSRAGRLRLSLIAPGRYTVQFSPEISSRASEVA